MMAENTKKNSPAVQFLLFIFLGVLFLSLGKFFHFDQEACRKFFQQFPLWLSAAVYVLSCILVTTFIWVGPKDIFLIVGALLFGPYLSSLLVFIIEMAGLLIFFNMSRRLGRGFVESNLPGWMRKLDSNVAGTNFWGVFFLRFFPLVPYRFLDLFMGLTKISLRKYFLISLLASPPRVFFLQFFLSLGIETIQDINKFSAYLEKHPVVFTVTFVYVLSAFVMVYVFRKISVGRPNGQKP